MNMWDEKLESVRLLRALKLRNINIRVEDRDIVVCGPKGLLDPATLQRILGAKEGLKNFLETRPHLGSPRDSEMKVPLESVVHIHTGNCEQTLFCIHTVTGNSGCYRGLSRTVGSQYKIMGINAFGYDSDWLAPASIVEMANFYVTQIVSIQPYGPYSICGYSMGGLIAIEVARTLRNRGLDVRRLFVVDTKFDQKFPSEIPRRIADQPDWMWEELAQLHVAASVAADARERHIFSYMSLSERLDFMTEHGRKFKPYLYDRRDLSLSELTGNILQFFVNMMRSVQAHVLLPYQGEMTYFLAKNDPRPVSEDVLRSVAAESLKVVQVPGNHASVVYDDGNLDVLGQNIMQMG